jgi:hypothetical protein
LRNNTCRLAGKAASGELGNRDLTFASDIYDFEVDVSKETGSSLFSVE